MYIVSLGSRYDLMASPLLGTLLQFMGETVCASHRVCSIFFILLDGRPSSSPQNARNQNSSIPIQNRHRLSCMAPNNKRLGQLWIA